MDKIQCLALAKGFLAGNFMNSMQSLANEHHWRSRFEDQLNVDYKEWLFKKVSEEFTKATKVEDFVSGTTGIVGEQLVTLEKIKEPIKKQIASNV